MGQKKKLTARVVRHFDPNTQTEAYIIRAIKGEELSVEDICRDMTKGLTLHQFEGEMGVKLFLSHAMEKLTEGYTISLGPLGKLQPTTCGRTTTDPRQLRDGDFLFRVAFRMSQELAAAMQVSKLKIEDNNEKDE